MKQFVKPSMLLFACMVGAFFLGTEWDNGTTASFLTRQSAAAQTQQGGRLEWESVPYGGDSVGAVHRARVPAGWLVVVGEQRAGGRFNPGLTFVPDAFHQWRTR